MLPAKHNLLHNPNKILDVLQKSNIDIILAFAVISFHNSHLTEP